MRPTVLQGSEPSYLDRTEQLQAVLCSTMEKVGGASGGAGPREGRPQAGRGLRLGSVLASVAPTPAHPRPLPPSDRHSYRRACLVARTSCGSVSRSWRTKCATCARSTGTYSTSPHALSRGRPSEAQRPGPRRPGLSPTPPSDWSPRVWLPPAQAWTLPSSVSCSGFSSVTGRSWCLVARVRLVLACF